MRLHGRPAPPSEEDIAREVQAYVIQRLPQGDAAPGLAMAGAADAGGDREKTWGIIEID